MRLGAGLLQRGGKGLGDGGVFEAEAGGEQPGRKDAGAGKERFIGHRSQGPGPRRRPRAGGARRGGRRRARARARVSWALVTGLGAVRFTGPARAGVRRTKRVAATASGSEIQLIHWRPLPSLPPRPRRKRGSMAARAPGPGPRTTPRRRWTTRMPASTAGWAAASHFWQTPARNPEPGEEVSSSNSAARLP